MWSDEKPVCPIHRAVCTRECAWYIENEVDVEGEKRMYRRCAVIDALDALETIASKMEYGW